ncbi:MarR family winged helix-turn-helix transcriptional regulator [Gordonia rubripertincta]|uniref:MarR family transcriptional regulator n=1 Tax=Gordonia rubripertincta TaxID=36822 RepID=A0ABT4MVK6_GORRU|nr:MarR family transcriptional regulator [Gordonia rubripertincta]MCZ4551044.1 MarR family transcriptional regulator [Gordonia rubripertincta]
MAAMAAGDRPVVHPLDEMLCFNLNAVVRATNRYYACLLAPWKLTYPQYLLLRLLWQRDTATVGEIASELLLDSGTTSPLVRRLESRGFVERQRSSDDERVVSVSLTSRGRALEDDLAAIGSQVGSATGLEVEQAQAMLSSLRTMNTSLLTALATRSDQGRSTAG